MKTLIVCFLLGTSLKFSTAEELPTGCPANEDPRYPTHLPHATDCTKFYKCMDGEPHLQNCEGGLQWSIVNSWCDYPENAKCVRSLPEDGEENIGEDGGENGNGGDGGETDLPKGCPANEDQRYPTHLPHATDCTKFYKCIDGVPHLQNCAGGLQWSIVNSWCDYPENAKCVRSLPEDGEENIGEDGGENGNGGDGGETDLPKGCPANEDQRYPTHLPHATDCTKFYKCIDGVPHLQNCAGGLQWSIVNSWCDYPENAKCVRSLPEDGEENIGEDGGENGNGGDGGETDLPKGCPANEDQRYPTHLPHATDCTKFYKCIDGVPHLQNCAGGLQWSIVNSWCDYPENAKCGLSLPEDGGENGGEGNGEDNRGETDLPTGCPANEDPRYPTHLPHATDCTKFYKCMDGEPHLQNCEGGLEWSIVNSWCDYPENAKCVRPLPEDGGENTSEESGEDGGGGGEGGDGGETDLPKGCPVNEDPRYPTHLPHATDCTKFYKCMDGEPHLQNCEGGLEWSIVNSWCDYPENANCVRPIPEDGGENGGGEERSEESGENGGEIVPTDCTENPTGADHLPHATDCTKFWQCVNGNAYLNECPSGLHWNSELQYCDYEANANCVRPLK